MSIKYGLLALLDGGPKYGYQLRAEFEHATGATWPLNVGQVYTTLNRLERDQLVHEVGRDEDGRVRYELTARGRSAVRSWFAEPVSRESRPRDELAIKLALAVTVPGVDVQDIVQRQRAATVRTLQELTRLKRTGTSPSGSQHSHPGPSLTEQPGHPQASSSDAFGDDLSWQLVLESMIFQAEAEIRWLEHVEARLLRAQRTAPPATPATPDTPATPGTTGTTGTTAPDDESTTAQTRSER